jgi:hypothetical protein
LLHAFWSPTRPYAERYAALEFTAALFAKELEDVKDDFCAVAERLDRECDLEDEAPRGHGSDRERWGAD